MTNSNGLSEEEKGLVRKVDRVIDIWYNSSIRNFSCLCDKEGLNGEGFSILIRIDPKYRTYMDYYLCGKIERNGRA